MRCMFLSLCAFASLIAVPLCAREYNGKPSNYQGMLRQLKPGDTLNLAPGKYPRLYLTNLNGAPDAWITIAGPQADPPAVIQGAPNYNTVEIENCSYVSIENLRIDSRGIEGAFGISAKGRDRNLTHHIRIEGNTFVGQNVGQQTDAISTKIPTWGWVIRYNKILGAGTGIYLGNSDGTQPFVDGVIENNLIQNTIGYDMEIKDQYSIPAISGMPIKPTSTIIRNNVFIKDDKPSPDGDRPNLIVGAFPETGLGSLNMYEIYGNYFVHNHREALFQGSGRVSLHDNIFIDGPPDYPAVILMKQNRPLKVALVYNNTVYTSGSGIRFDNAALSGDSVVGNLVFASNPISGPIVGLAGNITGPLESAGQMVQSPSFDPSAANFYPLPGKCLGAPIDLSTFRSDTEYTLDFNGRAKTQAKGAVVYRGAYAGDGENSGWRLDAAVKPPHPPLPKFPRLVWIDPKSARAGAETKVTLTGANFSEGATVTVSGEGVQLTQIAVSSNTEITGTLVVAAGTSGTREVTVTTALGASNSFPFRLVSGDRQR